MSAQHRLLQIFRAGARTGTNGTSLFFNTRDLEYIAAGYDKAKLRAPLVLGHPADNYPEYGETEGLFVKGEALYAEVSADDNLIGMVRRGSYKHVSPSFLMPDSPGNPTPGAYYLRHIGFLGAHSPAVKGMAALSFADRAECVSFAESYEISAPGAAHRLPVAPPGYQLSKAGTRVFMLAMEYQAACPSMPFSEAAQRADVSINNHRERKFNHGKAQ